MAWKAKAVISPPLEYEDLSADGFRRLGQRLKDLGYTPQAVTEELRLREVSDLYPLDYRFLPRWDESLANSRSEIAPAVRLLLLGLPEEHIRLERSLGEGPLDIILRTGLAYRQGAVVHPRLSIVPFADLLVVTDRLFRNADPESAEPGLSTDNCVWRLDRTTLLMSKRLKKGRVKKALELGCGSGVLSLLLAKTAEKITGIDINPRAIKVAVFNARLNGVQSVEFVQGDLYRPVAGQRFDYIFSNPPSAPGLVLAWNREGGISGREMVEAMLKGLEKHLAPGGTFQTTLHFGYRENADIELWVRKFVGSKCFGIQCELIGEEEDADTYALREAYQKAGARDYGIFYRSYLKYREGLRTTGIERVVFGLLSIEYY